jgi:hypothetical protein
VSTRPDASFEERVAGLADEVARAAGQAVRAGRDFLASEEGRELRHRIATSVVWAAPLIGEMPLIRRTPVGRILRIAGVTALLVKGAEWLRDWEPATVREA